MGHSEAVLAELERVLHSRAFVSSERLCRFLRFVVEAKLDGRGAELKEYTLGVEVFDRKPSYDPRIEPIVRVEARRLRTKLKEYYEADGRDATLRIELPRGGYAPEFRSEDDRATPPGAELPAIAVLPFSNLSTQSDNEYFSDGLTEEIIHALTRVERLRVVAWPSASHFKDKPHDIRGIGERLQVQAVLEGSVRKSGDRLRIAVQLVDVASGVYRWSESYERRMEDIFAIQEEIARAIADKLLRQFALPEEVRLARHKSKSIEAYHLYLRGRYHWNRRTIGAVHEAMRHFEAAIAADPEYAAPWAGVADVHTILAEWGVAPPRENMPKAKAAALRALELDDSLPDAHASLGLIYTTYERRMEDGRIHLERAIALNPSSSSARHWYAWEYLAPVCRLDEALTEIRRAQRLDPLSLIIGVSTGHILALRSQYDGAIEEYRRVLQLDPTFYRARIGIARALVHSGRHREGIALLEQLSQESFFSITEALLGHAYAVSGQLDRAQQVIDRLLERSRTTYVPAFALARIYLGIPSLDCAFDWLYKAYDHGESHLLHLKVAPIFDPLRKDPRYDDLLRKLGLQD